jgi:DNA-binding response OmpR family regulator
MADRVHVLVVDDDEELLEIVCFALRTRGYRVSEARTPAGARRLVDDEQPDFILCDDQTFLTEIASDYPDTIRILMWGSFIDEWATLLASGAVRSVLRKPFELGQLLACMTD